MYLPVCLLKLNKMQTNKHDENKNSKQTSISLEMHKDFKIILPFELLGVLDVKA